ESPDQRSGGGPLGRESSHPRQTRGSKQRPACAQAFALYGEAFTAESAEIAEQPETPTTETRRHGRETRSWLSPPRREWQCAQRAQCLRFCGTGTLACAKASFRCKQCADKSVCATNAEILCAPLCPLW